MWYFIRLLHSMMVSGQFQEDKSRIKALLKPICFTGADVPLTKASLIPMPRAIVGRDYTWYAYHKAQFIEGYHWNNLPQSSLWPQWFMFLSFEKRTTPPKPPKISSNRGVKLPAQYLLLLICLRSRCGWGSLGTFLLPCVASHCSEPMDWKKKSNLFQTYQHTISRCNTQ